MPSSRSSERSVHVCRSNQLFQLARIAVVVAAAFTVVTLSANQASHQREAAAEHASTRPDTMELQAAPETREMQQIDTAPVNVDKVPVLVKVASHPGGKDTLPAEQQCRSSEFFL